MASWLAVIAAAGKWVLIAALGIFVPTMMALVIYALRRGEPADADLRPSLPPFGPGSPASRAGTVAYWKRSKLKLLVSRQTFIPMESLVQGTATREEWAIVAGIQVALVSFWFIFLGVGLMHLSSSRGLSLAFPGVAGLWLSRIVKAQWSDFAAARRRLARSKEKAP
jgi:hypothetical protein